MIKAESVRSLDNINSLSEFPVGLWVAKVRGRSELFKHDSFFDETKIKIHMHGIGAMWGELFGPDGGYCVGDFRDSKSYAIDLKYFSECFSFSGWSYQPGSRVEILAISPNGEKITFKKSRPPRAPNADLIEGVWENKDNSQMMPLSIRENYSVFAVLDEWANNFRIYHDEAGSILLDSEAYGEVVFQPISGINRNRILFASRDGLSEYFKTGKKLGSQLLVDDYGRPLELNQVEVTINIFGNIAETTVDIYFTNINPGADEAQFSLPIPSNATVTGYSLDVNGVMVPGVAVPKEEAEEAFEILQNRGIDPGLAKISESNQFSTEIYPIRHQQQRRIQVTYLETLDSSSGGPKFADYQMPIHKFGQAALFKISVNVEADSPPKINIPKDDNYNKWTRLCGNSKCNYVNIYTYENFEFDESITVKFLKEELSAKIFRGPLGSVNYIVFGQTEKKANDTEYQYINIAWDVSLSMRRYHDDFVKFVSALLKKYPKSKIKIIPFSLSQWEIINIEPGLSKRAVKRLLAGLQYDGATNFDSLSRTQNGDADLNILFSDGINTSSDRFNIENLPETVVVYPEGETINLPLLDRVGKVGGVFGLNHNNSEEILDEMDNISVSVAVNGSVGEIVVSQPSLPGGQFRVLGEIKYEDLPEVLEIDVGGELYSVELTEVEVEYSPLGEKLWAAEQLAPLLSNPRSNKEKIETIGRKYGLSTPYTTLIVLEDLDEYVEFGINPPKVMDPDSIYDSLREKVVQQKNNERIDRLEDLVNAWESRLSWWETGEIKRDRYNYLWVDANCDVDEECGLEEVVVTGLRASLVPNIHIEPWNPDVPYLTTIKSAEPVMWLDIYYNEREGYMKSMPFYMDMAKFFFDNGRIEDGRRILSNILEVFPGKARMERLVAYILLENNLDELALPIFEHLNEIVPYQASSKRDLAMLYEKLGRKNSNNQYLFKALKLYYQAAVNSNDDPYELPVTALMEMNRLLVYLGNTVDVSWIDRRYLGDIDLDLRITLSWTNEFSMVDLYITEPSGEVVEWKDRVSKIGAWLPYDSWGNGPVEYLLKDAVPGDYIAKAVYWSDDDIEGFSPIGVRVDFYIDYGRQTEKHITSVIRLERVDEEYVVGKVFIPITEQ